MSNLSLPDGGMRTVAKQPFLSIVTLSFNQADYLRQALESVIKQKNDAVEFIVVDPGSTDGSRDIIAEYRDHIDTVILEPDSGPADGLNKGFAAARGRIGYFLNSDDFLMPRAVEALERQWMTHPHIGVLLGRAWRVLGNGAVERELLPTPNDRTTLASGAATIVQQGFSFAMNAFRAVGGFNAANRSTWDYELLAQFAAADIPFAIVNDRFGAFRLYADGISGGALGEAHQRRFDADYRRIHAGILGNPIKGDVMAFLWRGRSRKMLAHPSHALHRLRELALPRVTKYRFNTDMRQQIS